MFINFLFAKFYKIILLQLSQSIYVKTTSIKIFIQANSIINLIWIIIIIFNLVGSGLPYYTIEERRESTLYVFKKSVDSSKILEMSW